MNFADTSKLTSKLIKYSTDNISCFLSLNHREVRTTFRQKIFMILMSMDDHQTKAIHQRSFHLNNLLTLDDLTFRQRSHFK